MTPCHCLLSIVLKYSCVTDTHRYHPDVVKKNHTNCLQKYIPLKIKSITVASKVFKASESPLVQTFHIITSTAIQETLQPNTGYNYILYICCVEVRKRMLKNKNAFQ